MSNPIRMIITKEIKNLEYNPSAQYTFNLWCLWICLVQMPIVAVALVYFNKYWQPISIFYVAEISIWALVATHFGAMSAALAAKREDNQNKEK